MNRNAKKQPPKLLRHQLLTGARLTPEQHLHAGWVGIELAYGLPYQEAADDSTLTHLRASLQDATVHFNEIIEKPGANRVLAAQALVARESIPLYEGLLTGEIKPFWNGYNAFHLSQFTAAEVILKNYERFKNVRDIPQLHSLMVMILSNMDMERRKFAFPAPSRATHAAAEAKNSWTLQMWDAEKDRIYRVRVAATSPTGFLHIRPLELLENDKYPTSHGQGTLQALLDMQKTKKHMKFTAPSAHVRRVQARLVETIDSQLEAVLTPLIGEGETPENPAVKYLEIPAHQHSSHLDAASLDLLASQLETAYVAKNLTTHASFILGWVHLENAMKGATEGQNPASLQGKFDRAEEIFSDTATKYRREERSGLEYETMLARAASPIYKLISLHESGEVDAEEVQQTYINELADLGAEMLEDFDAIQDPNSQQAIDLYRSLSFVTCCLAATLGSRGGCLAGPSTPRQQGVGSEYRHGWDRPMTQHGFKPDYYGRIRLGETENPSSLDENVLTIPRSVVDSDNTFAILRDLISMIDKRELSAAQEHKIERLVDRLTAAAEAAEW